MQSFYTERFDREMGCTEPEWLGWLPNAMGNVPWQRHASSATAALGAGSFEVQWRTGEPRRIGLVAIPRMHMQFVFSGVDDATRYTFMKRFDLYMQRGGG